MHNSFRSTGTRANGAKTIRCAIYTRKSTEEGLDQDFNSLQAQREAAEAYIKSQKDVGWKLVPDQYDDGGFSGGTLDRPALARLLADVDARRVDCILVYKVDRLSRSLLDFARLMDRFDQRSVSFVSVTQQFNTTSSLGRLTLNILLSFAQFEREIIGERTRDKMSAARRKGKWVGGTPVLGYDVDPAGGRLIVNDEEADRVKKIFLLFKTHRSLLEVLAKLHARHWTNKSWKSQRGVEHVGRPFTKATLRNLLTNAIYDGKVEHRGAVYPGEQPAIVDPALWEKVNAQFRARQRERSDVARTKQNALLAGLLFCKSCLRPMIATYTAKRGRRFRYYVCQAAHRNGWASCPTKSVAATMIEDSVVAQLRTALSNEETRQQLNLAEPEWLAFLNGDRGELVRAVVERVLYDGVTGGVTLTLRSSDGGSHED
jgi:site-specific DNA recombinase